MNFSEKLQYYRKSTGQSQEDIAKKLNVTRQAVSKWESAQSEPDISTFLKLCEIFDITPSDFFDDKSKITDSDNDNKAAVSDSEKTDTIKNKLFFITLRFIMIIYVLSVIYYIIGQFTSGIPDDYNAVVVTIIASFLLFFILVIIKTVLFLRQSHKKKIKKITDRKK